MSPQIKFRINKYGIEVIIKGFGKFWKAASDHYGFQSSPGGFDSVRLTTELNGKVWLQGKKVETEIVDDGISLLQEDIANFEDTVFLERIVWKDGSVQYEVSAPCHSGGRHDSFESAWAEYKHEVNLNTF